MLFTHENKEKDLHICMRLWPIKWAIVTDLEHQRGMKEIQ